VHSLGFRVFRVRFRDGNPPAARVQIAPEEMPRLAELRARLEGGLLATGFGSVEIDPDGYGANPA
jgi:PP-loop superfamily ATP-utilizing enzyme